MTQYIAVAEKEYAKINNLIQNAKSTMTDQETKAATRLLGKKIIFYIFFDLIYFFLVRFATSLENRSQVKIAELDALANDVLMSKLSSDTESDSELDIPLEEETAAYPY